MTHPRGWGMTVALTLALWAGNGRAAGDPQDFSPETALWKGWVEASPVLGRAETLVSIDLSGARGPDGQIDHAILIQAREPLGLDAAGFGFVSFAGTTLTVALASGEAWSFSLARAVSSAIDSAAPSAISVWGLSHYWGSAAAQASGGALAAQLSPPLCSALLTDGDPACSNCASGGPGSPDCALDSGQCSTTCSEDAFACCSAETGCRCCKYREAGGA